jgi:hypothetical protein
MPVFVKIDGDGLVEAAIVQQTVPDVGWLRIVDTVTDPATEVSCAYSRELKDLCRGQLVGSEIVARPALDPITWDAPTKTVTVPVCPVGTQIMVADLVVKTVLHSGPADTTEPTTITLSDAGSYEIELTPPPPTLEQSIRITVDA